MSILNTALKYNPVTSVINNINKHLVRFYLIGCSLSIIGCIYFISSALQNQHSLSLTICCSSMMLTGTALTVYCSRAKVNNTKKAYMDSELNNVSRRKKVSFKIDDAVSRPAFKPCPIMLYSKPTEVAKIIPDRADSLSRLTR